MSKYNYIEMFGGTKDESYYVIDLSKISNITLNYGKGTLENEDIYIINDRTLEIYYLKGIITNNTIYYNKYKDIY